MLILQEVSRERELRQRTDLPDRHARAAHVPQVRYYFSDYELAAPEVGAMIAHMHEPIAVVQQSSDNTSTEVRLFDSRESWLSWLLHHSFGEQMMLLEKFASEARLEHQARSGQMLHGNPAPIELPTAEPPMRSLAVLHESEDLRGRAHAFSHVLVPDLMKLSVRQKAMSLRVSGIAMLAQHSWFSGAKVFFVGEPVLELTDLAVLKIIAAPRSLAVL